jgi:hypothetical protein
VIETYLRGYNTAAFSSANGGWEFAMRERPGLKVQTVTLGGRSATKWWYEY